MRLPPLPSHHAEALNLHPAALIGYWIAPFCAIALTEHFLFRRSYAAYAVADAWDDPRHPDLPRPYAALCALAGSAALIVLCMQQEWFTGPIARLGTGDVGMLVGFVLSVGVYAGVRWMGRKVSMSNVVLRLSEVRRERSR